MSPARRVLTYAVVAVVAAGLAVGVARSGLFDRDTPSPPGGERPADTAPSVFPTQVSPSAQASSTAGVTTDVPVVADSRYVRIKVITNPSQARVTLDGAALDVSPFEGKFPKDGAFHRVGVEATGFFPQTKMVKFDRDQEIQFFLHSRKGPRPNPY